MQTYDYKKQVWIDAQGKYVSCSHPDSMNCQCFGKLHAGECSGKHNSVQEIIQCAECSYLLR